MDHYISPDRSLRRLPRGYINWKKWELDEPIQAEIVDPFPCKYLTLSHLHEILVEFFTDAEIVESTLGDIPVWRVLEFSDRKNVYFEVEIHEHDDHRYLAVSHDFYPAYNCKVIDRIKFEDLTLGHGYRVDIEDAENQWGFKACLFDGFVLSEFMETSQIKDKVVEIFDEIIALRNRIIDVLLVD